MPTRFRCPRRDRCAELCPAKKIFSCLSPRQDTMLGRERLARHYEPHQIVIHHDTPALAVLSIHSGLVQLIRPTTRGRRVAVGLRQPGQLLGVREVLSAMPYQVSVETLEPSVLCAVPREAFLAAVRDCPDLAMRLLAQMARDYLLTEEQLVAGASLSVRARAARLLLGLGGEPHSEKGDTHLNPIPMAREEMSLLVGTTRETLSRTLSYFVRRGALRIQNGRLRILDASLLERMAE